jgi:hypothetical protein
LLKKIEELTLYTIQQERALAQQQQVNMLRTWLDALEQRQSRSSATP